MKKIIPLALLVLMAGGCSRDDGGIDAKQLANHSFSLESVDGVNVSGEAEKQAEIAFSDDLRVSGVMCNRFFGQGELNGDVLTVKQIGSTRMLCSDNQLSSWDGVISDVLNNGATIKLEQDSLTLTGNGHTLKYQAAK